jgi:hypothetical protein
LSALKAFRINLKLLIHCLALIQEGFRYRRCDDVSFGSVEVACALADLVRAGLDYMLAVQALSEMEQRAAGVSISDGSVNASACLGLGCDCVWAGDHGCDVSAAGRCLESLDRALRTTGRSARSPL